MRRLTPFVLGIILFAGHHLVKPLAKGAVKGTVKTIKIARKVII